MNKVTVTNDIRHQVLVNGFLVGEIHGTKSSGYYLRIWHSDTGRYTDTTIGDCWFNIARRKIRNVLSLMTVDEVIEQHGIRPKAEAKPTLPADEFGPSLKYTLTLRDWPEGGEDGEPEHTTVATCDSKAHMVQAVQRLGDEAYKHYVTVWSHEDCADGDIVEQVNAAEWLEDELMQYA